MIMPTCSGFGFGFGFGFGLGFGLGFGFGFGLPVSMVPSCVSSGALTAMPKSVSLIPPM